MCLQTAEGAEWLLLINKLNHRVLNERKRKKGTESKEREDNSSHISLLRKVSTVHS